MSRSPATSALKNVWRPSTVFWVAFTDSWSVRISIWACSQRVASDCAWALNSARAWVMSSWTAAAAPSESARWLVSTPTTLPVTADTSPRSSFTPPWSVFTARATSA
eukprot:13864811-Alexandrium_andersonii.AAC.1